MPTSPTPWAMEEPPLPLPAEILVAGGDAPLWIAETATGHAVAEPPATDVAASGVVAPRVEPPMAVDVAPQARPSGTGGVSAAIADGASPGRDDAPRLVVDAPASDSATQGGMPWETEVEPPAEDAFPSLAALDAIRAAFAADPPGPDAAARADFAALLGLDSALAAEEAAFLDALRGAPAPDGAALLAEWLSEAVAREPPAWALPAPDWPLG
ncbi:hypothetical protein J5Y09_01160 [Roseomonas sp. PWR1]|uniref:Uncharacterized protein n=1 Tax=Roseomonas nitratireducens TaxID=2820810 RepID=A0ABS4ANU2_9PROT|nr:hypothetical protein [Neoroseomonas nitratireducens]MBP0462506.1 hypothetical protein [Neoroseomonas nitratireducens]